MVRAKLTGPWEGGGIGGKNTNLYVFFFFGIIGIQVFMQSTFFGWFLWIIWWKIWWCSSLLTQFYGQKWQFKVSINFSKSPHQIFLLFLRCCYWNPNKKGGVNVSDGSRQKWKKISGEGCWNVWRKKKTFIIYKLIKCSNPNTPLP